MSDAPPRRRYMNPAVRAAAEERYDVLETAPDPMRIFADVAASMGVPLWLEEESSE